LNKNKIEWLTGDLGQIRLLDLSAEEQLDAGKSSSSGFVGGGENEFWNDRIRRKPSSITSCYRKFDLGPAMYLSPNPCDLLSSPVLRKYWEKKTRQQSMFGISVRGERGKLGFFGKLSHVTRT
jgi:hypothetical protein